MREEKEPLFFSFVFFAARVFLGFWGFFVFCMASASFVGGVRRGRPPPLRRSKPGSKPSFAGLARWLAWLVRVSVCFGCVCALVWLVGARPQFLFLWLCLVAVWGWVAFLSGWDRLLRHWCWQEHDGLPKPFPCYVLASSWKFGGRGCLFDFQLLDFKPNLFHSLMKFKFWNPKW